MAVYATKGSKVSIGAAVAIKSGLWVTADFTAPLTAKTEIKEPETLAMAAEEFAGLEFENVTDGALRTLQGPRKPAAMEFTHGLDYADAGQLAVKAAFEAGGDYAFEIEFSDKPSSGASPKNSKRQFIGRVMKVAEGGDGGVMKFTYTVQPNSNIVRVNASAT